MSENYSKVQDISTLIQNLIRWKLSREEKTKNRTYGAPLDVQPLQKAIDYLKEYKEILKKGKING